MGDGEKIIMVKKKTNKKKSVKCSHYKGDGYYYELNDNENLEICEQCHLNLAPALIGQVVIEALISGTWDGIILENLENQSKKIAELEKKFDKLNKKKKLKKPKKNGS